MHEISPTSLCAIFMTFLEFVCALSEFLAGLILMRVLVPPLSMLAARSSRFAALQAVSSRTGLSRTLTFYVIFSLIGVPVLAFHVVTTWVSEIPVLLLLFTVYSVLVRRGSRSLSYLSEPPEPELQLLVFKAVIWLFVLSYGAQLVDSRSPSLIVRVLILAAIGAVASCVRRSDVSKLYAAAGHGQSPAAVVEPHL